MLERIQSMLARSDTDQRVMPATELFNEGWLLRSALDWFADHPGVTHELAVPSTARWYSEALLPSPFLARWRGDPLAERHTHADGVVGQFRIGDVGAGDLALERDATHFVVLEAKVHSRLSAGTTKAPGYDQAARSVACMAHILSRASRRPEDVETLGFYVVAPASKIERGAFAKQLAKESIGRKVSQRVAAYKDAAREAWLTEWFLPMLDRIPVGSVSWEGVAASISAVEAEAGRALKQFYRRCLEYA